MAGVSVAQRTPNPEAPDGKLFLMRSPSAASDVTTRSTSLAVPPTSPAPAYFAQSAASELITSEIDRPVVVSRSALVLVNEFLDQVLYNIFLASRSTSLSLLKAAVPAVLKPRLGKAALKVAEEELKEYLNDDEEDELNANPNSAELKHEFEPELAWKLARLRCMVYTRHGDLEEEDEEDWLEKEGLRTQLQAMQQTSQIAVATGPASAIFLTSVLEFLGEQALYYAAQHAQKKHYQNGGQQVHGEDLGSAGVPASQDEIIIDNKDMNHVGRDSPLSRLWRSYRRTTRETSSRPISPELRTSHGLAKSHSRGASSVTPERAIAEESRSPHQIPLPMSDNDVNEIEVPGLAAAISDDEDDGLVEAITPPKPRPVSMIIIPGQQRGSTDSIVPETPEIPERNPTRPTWTRKRSLSSPVSSLPRASGSSQNLLTRDDLWSRDNRRDVSERTGLAKGSKQPGTAREQRSSVSPEQAAVDSEVRHADSSLKDIQSEPVLDSENYDDEPAYTEVTMPKKTVAEEMLGVTPSVAPPQDATTGASITNMSDFYSMHVPVAVASDQGSPITPSVVRDGAFFTAPGQDSEANDPRDESTDLYQTDGADDHPQENLKPAPLRTASGRPGAVPSTTDRSGRETTATAKKDLSLLTPKSPDNDLPMSAASTTGSLPTSPSSAVVGTAVSVIPPRGASAQVRHVKVDSRGSVKAPESRNSSDAGRATGVGRSASGRSQTVTQPRLVSGPAEEFRPGPSPSAVIASRESHPSTGNSSVSKRFHGKPLQLGDESDEAKKRSLEILIRGNETLHYTLTPAAAMRDEKTRAQTSDASDNIRSTSVSAQDSAGRTGLIGQTSNLPKQPLTPSRVVPRATTPITAQGVVFPASPSQSRNPLGEPRDPRTEKSSNIQDLADYARSTGPLDAKQLPKPISPRMGLPASPRPTSATVAAATTAKAPAQAASRQPKTPSSPKSANRLKQQARDPRAARGNDSTELIDFIREGPPSAVGTEGREHRIDRRVAPFRTTMDSEDFDHLTQGRGIGSSVRGSDDGRPAPSVDPSVTSQTPLIVSNGQSGRGVIPAAPISQSIAESDGMPKRTRRRIKDPYAIYDSDDDEELENELASNNRRNQEESLIDFLRNASPPAGGSAPQPILAGRISSRPAEQAKAPSARETSPHLTQSGSKMDTYRPTQPTHAAHVERNRPAQPDPVRTSDKPRTQPRFEARDAKATRVNTAELAEYLKNSGPPPNSQFQPQPFILSGSMAAPKSQSSAPAPVPASAPKEEGGLFKRFSKQRKK